MLRLLGRGIQCTPSFDRRGRSYRGPDVNGGLGWWPFPFDVLSGNTGLGQRSIFRPFCSSAACGNGRDSPGCDSVAFCDQMFGVRGLEMVGKCRAAAARLFPTIPAHLHANKRSKNAALPQPSISRQNVKWERPPSQSAINVRHPIRALTPIAVRRTLNTSVRQPKHHAAMSTPDKVLPAARQTHPAVE